jgi:aminoglycoside phosphotransferase (APT) family kinase protein
LSSISGYLEESLAGRPLVLSRQHGDLAPSNVLWDSANATVSGIVDWKLADQLLPPEVDLTHYAVSLIALRRRIEYGATVTWLLGEGRDSQEAEVARYASENGPNDLGLRCSVTLAWLQHVSFGLQKAVDLQSNAIWLTNNIDRVVQDFNR